MFTSPPADIPLRFSLLPVTFQQSWMWAVQNKEWVLSGIGTAIVMAALGYVLTQKTTNISTEPQHDIAAERDVNIIDQSQGPSVISTGKDRVVTDCVKMLGNRRFENVGYNRWVRMSPESKTRASSDTRRSAVYVSSLPFMRKLFPSMTTVSA